MHVSIIIRTANRAEVQRETICSLARVRRPGTVELLVVDNRSSDHTREVVEEAARYHPYAVRYLYEAAEGKYAALSVKLTRAERKCPVVRAGFVVGIGARPRQSPLQAFRPGLASTEISVQLAMWRSSPAYLIAWAFVRLFQFRVFPKRISRRLHFDLRQAGGVRRADGDGGAGGFSQ